MWLNDVIITQVPFVGTLVLLVVIACRVTLRRSPADASPPGNMAVPEQMRFVHAPKR